MLFVRRRITVSPHRIWLKEPLINSRVVATATLLDGMREAVRSEWPTPFTSAATKQATSKAPSHTGFDEKGPSAALRGLPVVRLLVPRRAPSIQPLFVKTRLMWELIRGSLRFCVLARLRSLLFLIHWRVNRFWFIAAHTDQALKALPC